MEMHQLRYFLAIVRGGSITAAAQACNVSQPTLSAQLAKLEDELGGPLFERGRQGARLSARGELFRPHAAEALARLELGRAELEDLDGLRRGRVALGCLPSTGAFLLPRLLSRFGRDYPAIRVELREESSPGLARALLDAEIDLAVTDDAGMAEGLEGATLFREELLAAVPAGHRLAGRAAIALSELDGEPLVAMKPGHGFRAIMMAALAAAGVAPRVVYESAEIATVQALVKAGLGLSLIPRIVRQAGGPAYVAIAAPAPSRTILVAWRRGAAPSPAAAALRATALACLAAPDGPPAD